MTTSAADSRVAMFEARLSKNEKRFRVQFARDGTDAYRVYDHDIPELPFTVEKFGTHAVLTEVPGKISRTDAAHATFINDVAERVARVLEIAPVHVVVKRRVRRLKETQWEVQGESTPVVATERGARFVVDLTSHVDTGLFLDHRPLRKLVESQSANKRVLNLFCYTGAFTIFAARGGAVKTVSVDLSNTALARLRENLSLNDLDAPAHEVVRADCLAWLEAVPSASFDVVVLDPPTHSRSKRADHELDVQRDHRVMVQNAHRALAPGGVLYFSNNLSTFSLDVDVATTFSLQEITTRTVPPDFRGRPHRTFVAERKI